ncbi:tRNA lysidine(34) synthetase TilS [Tetragenococcus koreensis]|uniref:tRNA lysidine(34) synthetase TilS n=1 Tax=Tetragenococcus koreensis TaxID=290335 RepID=UPI000F4E5724|nr:tRNA lysidine(34) synthetase TilS [Tetragenococcus koreensis]AYW45994.1 tRNA lysidine(34) synthetase TilS [Tetragenococcus koreensis]MDN6662893.1 tRNA lysidine(34) synthetase TilS [Tetragenococcus koreensis]GEN90928.1 tRNA(Ile)-lysidine synthase [Tetragenococcus koreensis]
MLSWQVEAFIKEKKLLTFNDRVLVAVSTGVDSMVLLHILETLQEKIGFAIGVAHVNHRLRKASDEEENFLRNYCQKKSLPFYATCWHNPPTTGVEEKARTFRYNFFKETMQTYDYQVLTTAHHSDDQMETMIMKMVREGNLFSAKGILPRQSFGKNQVLVRPLLNVAKQEILDYSKENGIVYFEDQTNASLDMQRNRIRHQVVPLLKEENKQALQHFQQLSRQLSAAQEIISEQQEHWYQANIKEKRDEFEIDVNGFLALSQAQRFFFLEELTKKARQYYGLTLSAKQIGQVMELLAKEKAHWEMDVEQTWQFQKSYGQLFLRQSNSVTDDIEPTTLHTGQSSFLSANEWVGIFPKDQVKVPEKVKLWLEYRQNLTLEFPSTVIFRRRRAGDRIQLNEQLNKKISRFFIDKKTPRASRDEAWVITDLQGNVLGLLPYVFSYLCIAKETAKIHYVLLYKYRE